MAEQHLFQEYDDLIIRYLSGEANAAETQMLEDWVLEKPAHKAYFIKIKRTWMLIAAKQDHTVIDVDQQWQAMQTQIAYPTSIERKIRVSRSYVLAIAASLALLLMAGWWWINQMDSKTILASAEIEQINLTDGSQIMLNKGGKIKFKDFENASTRAIELEGDAYFDVAKDDKKSFVIQTPEVTIEVLGTSFYVDARVQENLTQIMVESGKVAVKIGNDSVQLAANEQAIYNKSSRSLLKQPNKDPNYQAIKTKTLVFNNTNLETVIFVLNRQFNAQISLANESLLTCILSATYNQKSLDDILDYISKSLGITIIRQDQQIILDGSC